MRSAQYFEENVQLVNNDYRQSAKKKRSWEKCA